MEKAQVMATTDNQKIDTSETQLQTIDNQHSNDSSNLDREFELFRTLIQKIKAVPVLALKKLADYLSDAKKKNILLSSLDHAKLKCRNFGSYIVKAGVRKVLRKTGLLNKPEA